MDTDLPSIPESCSQCPHIDRFHSSCSHPLRQNIISGLESNRDTCPVYSAVRADAMRDLEDQIR